MDPEAIKRSLQGSGLRCTPQRYAVMAFLMEDSRHPTAAEIFEAVNRVGSLFYGTLLGCFVLALGFRHVRGTATFIGMLVGEAAILATSWFTNISWLWYSGIGSAVVVLVALTITWFSSE